MRLLKALLCFSFLLFISATTFAGPEDPDYDEVTVFITVPGLGSTEIPSVIYNESIYLSVSSLFDFLRIKNTLSSNMDSVSGYFINPQAKYLIDRKQNRIIFDSKLFELGEKDLIQTESNLYLRSTYFGKVFGLECVFSFRSLSVILNTTTELPVIRQMRQESMRNNVRQLRGELVADTTIAQSYPTFHFGMADWSIVSAQDLPAGNNDMKAAVNTRCNLALGGIVAGGETNLTLNLDNSSKFSEKQQYYLWRFVNNKSKYLKQIIAGKIFSQASASIFNPVVGVQITNAPTTYRRSFGTYVLSNYTEPNWMVELYVNNVLVNYLTADASGFYKFEVPLVYGSSVVRLRFYGPYGEERSTEQNINIPFNFIPKGESQYTLSAGMVEDSLHSRYSRASLHYGVGKALTLGGGMEYLSSVNTGKIMPFANASLRVGANLLYSGEYIYGVRMKNVLSYRLPSNVQFELSQSQYKKGQTAINNTFVKEGRAVFSFPIQTKKISMFSRLTYYQVNLPNTRYNNIEALFSGILFGVNANFTTYALMTSSAKPFIYSNLSSTLRLPGKIIFTPQLQYDFNRQKLISIKGEFGRAITSHGYANVFFEKNYKSQLQSVGVSIRCDFSAAQLSFSGRHSSNVNTMIESARGSLLFNHSINYFGANSRTSVGRGGVAIIPFLDLNSNGKRDNNEPKAFGCRVLINGGRIKYDKADTSIIISDLEAYASYFIRLNTEGFDNIAWQIHKKTINVSVDPNKLKLIEVPVTIMGEVSGLVLLEGKNENKGQGRMLVNFYRPDGSLAGQTLTESDGYFDYPGLVKGTYTARIDEEQLRKLHIISSPVSYPVTISGSLDGDVIDGLDFKLHYSEELEKK